MSQDLSEAVKAASREVHSQAENSEFMKNFQKGQVTRDGFKVCGLGGPALVWEGMTGVGVCAQGSGQWCKWGSGPGLPRDQMGMSKGIILQDDDLEAQRGEVTFPRSHSKFTACCVVWWRSWGSSAIN